MDAIHAARAQGRTLNQRVLGVDPGLTVTGYAVLEPARTRWRVVEAGVIRPGSPKMALARRLEALHAGILEVIDAHAPGALAVEQVHSHARFPAASLLMAHGRGVILLSAALRSLEVFGYAPARIKKCLTGNGRAPKEQMQEAIRCELGLRSTPTPHDVADACALALCHLQLTSGRLAVAAALGVEESRRG